MEQPIYIIAEAGVNHNGSLEMARKLVDAAVSAGADAVKFQMFKAENIVSIEAPKAQYQQQTTDANESQYDMLKKLEFGQTEHEYLHSYCQEVGIDFLSTPYDFASLEFLTYKLQVSQVKIPSADIVNSPMLLQASTAGAPVMLSTGMSSLGEIETALSVLAYGYTRKDQIGPSLLAFQEAYQSKEGQAALRQKVTLLHCTTEYPCPVTEVNLRAMDTLRGAFGLHVGYSDHSEGIAIAIAAAAQGARIIEKHFTLDKNLPGPDHRASANLAEMKEMVTAIRQVQLAMGSPVKMPTPVELRNRAVMRRSLVANCDIKKGELFTEDNLSIKRPGDGVSPQFYWNYLGKMAERDYLKDEKVGI